MMPSSNAAPVAALFVCAIANLIATVALGWLMVKRPRAMTGQSAHLPPALNSRPASHTHRIAAFTLSGDPLPDFYLGDDDHEVNRKWNALKVRKNSGHWELWHAKHGKRDSITRGAV